jgi:hypothetical protein
MKNGEQGIVLSGLGCEPGYFAGSHGRRVEIR